MIGLQIKDKVLWHSHWSSEIGERLDVHDSSNDFFVFAPRHGREEVRRILAEAPDSLYQLFEVEEASEEFCDFMADSGTCYRKLQ